MSPVTVMDSNSEIPSFHMGIMSTKMAIPVPILDTMPKRFLLTLPLSNKRMPPLVDRNWLSYRLMTLSRGQLELQASLKEPDLRRCVAHAHLHRHSTELTHRDLMRLIESFALEEDDSDDSACSSDEQAAS